MTDEPTLSVLVPAYNEAEYIEACAESIIDQLGVEDQLFLGSDGSTDDTPELIDAIADGHEQVTAVVFEDNQGQLATSQNLAKPATKDVLVRIDADCVLEPGTLDAIRQRFATGANLVYGKVSVANTDGLHPAACQLGKERGRAKWHGGACIAVDRAQFMADGGFAGMNQNVEQELMFRAEREGWTVDYLSEHGVRSHFPTDVGTWLRNKYDSGKVYVREVENTPDELEWSQLRGPAFWTAAILGQRRFRGSLPAFLAVAIAMYARDSLAIRRVSGRWSHVVAYPLYKAVSGIARTVGVMAVLPTLLTVVARRYGGNHE